MQLIRGLYNVPDAFKGCVATIGNYDGIHRGHQRVLAQVRDLAKSKRAPSLIISFEPTPLEFFRPDVAPARLTRFREKYRLLKACGLDGFLHLRFNRHFADLSPDEFILEILVNGIAVSSLVVGDDFRFGRDRGGDFETLCQAGVEQGFEVSRVATIESDEGTRISSSAIRSCLATGELEDAAQMLGRPYSMTGRVIRGQELGRTLGYPTANLELHRRNCPLQGIYAVRVHGVGGEPLSGVSSLGTRPTVGGETLLLETHIFDFDDDIYGQYIDIEFVAKIREELYFDSLSALTEQMHDDAAKAREILKNLDHF